MSHISLGGITDELTGHGCGDVVAISSFDLGPVDVPEQIEPSLRLLRERGQSLAQFSPGRNGDLPWDPDEIYGPFWNLPDRERPGPTVQIFAMGPSCEERGPEFASPDLLALAQANKAVVLGRGRDPRAQNPVVNLVASVPLLTEPPIAAAIGRFFRDDPTPNLVAVLFDDQHEMVAFRLLDGAPPQRMRVDPTPFKKGLEVVRQGIAPVDVDGDGVDELVVLMRGRGDQAQLNLYRLGAEDSPLLRHRLPGSHGWFGSHRDGPCSA